MRTHRLLIPSLAFALLLPAQAAGKVKVYLDGTRTGYVMVDKLDCKVYEEKSGVTIGFKAGNLLFAAGPAISLGRSESIRWDRTVQGLIARYKELCSRFNSGAVTMEEYEERLAEIDSIAVQMQELQQTMMKRVKAESDKAFDELEVETGDGRAAPVDVDASLEQIHRRLEELE